MISVHVKDVSLNFGTVEVLKRLNLEVAEGEFIVLLGPSGCGKSTLLNCIAGLLDVSAGQIFINGKNVTVIYNHLSAYRSSVGQSVSRGQVVGLIGTTGWSTGCHTHFTVMENGTPVDPMKWF